MHVNRCCNSGRQKCDEEREAEKVPKYKDLITEIQNMWNVEAKVIADNNNRGNWNHLKVTQYLNNLPGKHKIKQLQKAVILGTADTLREVLM